VERVDRPVSSRGLLILLLLAHGYGRDEVAGLVGGPAALQRDLREAERSLGAANIAQALELALRRGVIIGPLASLPTERLAPRRTAPVAPSTRFVVGRDDMSGRYGVWDDQVCTWATPPSFDVLFRAVAMAETLNQRETARQARRYFDNEERSRDRK
jgi:hypothetical protein